MDDSVPAELAAELLYPVSPPEGFPFWTPIVPRLLDRRFETGSKAIFDRRPNLILDTLVSILEKKGKEVFGAVLDDHVIDLSLDREKVGRRAARGSAIVKLRASEEQGWRATYYVSRLCGVLNQDRSLMPPEVAPFRCEVAVETYILHQIARAIDERIAFSSFILMSCVIDHLAQWWVNTVRDLRGLEGQPAPAALKGDYHAYQEFIRRYMCPDEPRYVPEDLRRKIRNGLVHNFVLAPDGTYTLTDHQPERHLTLKGTQLVLNAETFLWHIADAKARFFREIVSTPVMWPGFMVRYRNTSTIGVSPPFQSHEPF